MEGNDYYYLRYPPIQIEETLRLRRFDGNYDFAFEWYQDPETVLLVDGKAEPYSHETLTNMYNYLNSKGELYFIEVNENGEWKPIGDVTFWQEDMPIVIGEREYRGKGIGKKVVSALVERGKAMGYDKLYVGEIYDFNICSQKCFESVGFRSYEKTEKGSRYVLNLKELKEL
ncbi:MAG: GNAT family N-acetyltransferase [Clostridia bacterium]|nr:GNAT family N-acetyltransferase [Clostridia bacterium]